GALLLGTGDGHFTVARADASGVLLPEDTVGLVEVVANKQHRRFVVGVNSGTAVTLKSNAALKTLDVALEGSSTLIDGSQLQVTYEDGKNQIRQISAGNGYLSHSGLNSVTFGYSTDNPPKECTVILSNGTSVKKLIENKDQIQFILE
ncbi:MAG: hypothetical protein KDB27_14230, partial [Planctomycetales bacterium]|nr:hypothetical protein [Planctomycetales bacterium]